MVISQNTENALLYVKDKGRVRGPFLRSFIDAMILSGHFSTTIEVSLNGKSDWTRIASVPHVPSSGATLASKSSADSSDGKAWKVILGVLATAGLGIILILAAKNSGENQTSNSSSARSSSVYPTPAPVVESTPVPVSTPLVENTPRPVSTPIIPVYNSTAAPTPSSYTSSDALWYNDFITATKKAQEENKLVLLYFSGSDWCPWSRIQKNELLNDFSFQSYAAQNYILVQIDFPYRKYPDSSSIALKKNYIINEFPTLALIRPDGTLVKRHDGLLRNGFSGFRQWLNNPSVYQSSAEFSPYSAGDFPIFMNNSTASTSQNTPTIPPPVFPRNYQQPSSAKPSSYQSVASGDETGPTYSYPHSQAYRLIPYKNDVANKKLIVQSSKERLRILGNEVENDRGTLDKTSQYEIDNFNAKVRRYNQLQESVNIYIDEYHAAINAYNAELERIGTKVRN